MLHLNINEDTMEHLPFLLIINPKQLLNNKSLIKTVL
jgi:hypothetical protein